MTTKLEEVLAEEWKASEVRPSWEEAYGPVVSLISDDMRIVGNGYVRDEEAESERTRVRAAVAVLGKRALAMVLRIDVYRDRCQECGRHREDPAVEHREDCEWGRIVEEAKALG